MVKGLQMAVGEDASVSLWGGNSSGKRDTGHPAPNGPGSPTTNLLIAALPANERELLLAESHLVELKIRRRVSELHQPVENVYFPASGIISLVVGMIDGSTVEMATIGREGVVGFPMAIGDSSGADAMVQVNGQAFKMPAGRFKYLLSQTVALPDLLKRFEGALFQLIGRNAACNRLHTTEQRLSRWMLMVQDRVGSGEYKLTHEFLAMMLGVRRASISEAAERVKSIGAINYSHGHVQILDRTMLEGTACECYGSIRDVFHGLYS